MKEFVKAVLPHLKQFSWKLDAVARIGKKAWTVFEENGESAQLVFRKDGRLLLVRDGQMIDSSWELVEEMKAIVLEVNGKRKVYDAAWGEGPLMIFREHASDQLCALVDSKWMEGKQVPFFMSFVVANPLALSFGYEGLCFTNGWTFRLESGQELRTQRKFSYAKRSQVAPNHVVVDWQAAEDGLYWTYDSSVVVEVVEGSLWMVYKDRTGVMSTTGIRAFVYCDTVMGRVMESGNIVVVEEAGIREMAPDGEYKCGIWKTLTVLNGRVV